MIGTNKHLKLKSFGSKAIGIELEGNPKKPESIKELGITYQMLEESGVVDYDMKPIEKAFGSRWKEFKEGK